MTSKPSIEEVEIDLLIEAISRVYGYDFRNYAKASLRRRVKDYLLHTNIKNPSQLQEKIIRDENLFDGFLLQMSITVTEMFRDPVFYREFREKVVPTLKTYPYIKIWHAGCATGEEVYSMAILLYEEGLLSKATIYATDFNNYAIKKAKEGIFSDESIKKYTNNYISSGGKSSLSDYYIASYRAVKMLDFLQKRVTFANHNLATDQVFGEMNLILCRNVLIYFDSTLQARVYKLFQDSLCSRGYLCLGMKETLEFSPVRDQFEVVVKREKIYRKLS